MSGRPDVPVRTAGEPEPRHVGPQPVLDVLHPRRDALGSTPVRAQEPEAAQRLDGRMGLARPGRLDHGPTLFHGQAAYAAQRLERSGLGRIDGNPFHVRVATPEDGEHGIGVPPLDGLGQLGNGAAVAVDPAQDDDAVAHRGRARPRSAARPGR